MATDLFKGFSNKITGESFRCLSSTPEAFIIEWKVEPNGFVPFEHIHLNQDELFQVVSGEVKFLIEGKQHIAGAGETITVDRGKAHIAFNNKNEILKCIVEYRPGLDMFKFYQCMGGLVLDNDLDSKGQMNMSKLGYFTKRMNAKCITRPTNIPASFFKLGLFFIYIIGSLRGWDKLFKKYTENTE
jgi:quercetin dioxygenase-like cupin family protein